MHNRSSKERSIACAGLCVSRHTKLAGRYLFDAAVAVVTGVDGRFGQLDAAFSQQINKGKALPQGLDFGFCVLMWTALKLGSDAQSYQHDVVCKMLPDKLVAKASAALDVLKHVRVPSASGNDLVKATAIPSHLRGALLVRLNVLGRINGARPDVSQGSILLNAIIAELYATGTDKLKPAYAPDPKQKPKPKSNPDSQPRSKLDAAAKAKPNIKASTKPKETSKEKTKTKTKSRTKSKTKTKRKSASKAKSNTKSKTQPKPKPN